MGFLAFGIFLLVVGLGLSVTTVPSLVWAGWACLALGSVLLVIDLAVGPRRAGARRLRDA